MIRGGREAQAVRNTGEPARKSVAQALEKPVENGWISMSGVVGEDVRDVCGLSRPGINARAGRPRPDQQIPQLWQLQMLNPSLHCCVQVMTCPQFLMHVSSKLKQLLVHVPAWTGELARARVTRTAPKTRPSLRIIPGPPEAERAAHRLSPVQECAGPEAHRAEGSAYWIEPCLPGGYNLSA